MGDPKRRRKKYNTPGHPYEQNRLEAELVTVGKYGLRNKRELWKARTQLGAYRQQARKLLAHEPEERERLGRILVNKLTRLGVLPEGATTDDVLALQVEDILSRRLQTRVYELGYANTIHQARQMIVHRHIMFGDHIINIPSFLVPIKDEEKIKISEKSPFSKSDHPMLPQNISKAQAEKGKQRGKTRGRKEGDN